MLVAPKSGRHMATRISGRRSDTALSQFEAARTKKCKEPPQIWDRGVAQRRTRAHDVARGRTRSDEGARGRTRAHEVARMRTRSDEVARRRTRSHEGARGRSGARGASWGWWSA